MQILKNKTPRLVSSRIVIRHLEPHEAALVAHFRRENKAHLEPWEPKRRSDFFTEVYWQKNLRQNLKDFREGTSVCLSILSPEENEVLGVCNYTSIVRGTFQSCHLGYSLAKKHQGKGIMYEALQLTNRYIFAETRLHRIMAGYLPHNDRSGNLLQRLGFEREGYAREYLKINGVWEDHILTSLINSQF